MSPLKAPRRLLASTVVDLLVGPHGIDSYLELVRPSLTVLDPRAEVIEIHHQTARSVTIRLRPNGAWTGFQAGQSVSVGVEINGVRHTRTYSPASVQRPDGDFELTVTAHPEGRVSNYLKNQLQIGDVLYLGEAFGDFVLPRLHLQRLVLISGGSGITPVMSMLRTLCDEGYRGELIFLHYARTAADWPYRDEVLALAALHGNVQVEYVATREGGAHVSEKAIRKLLGREGVKTAWAGVCGPPQLIDAVREVWSAFPGGEARVLSETFTLPRSPLLDEPGTGTVRFTLSDHCLEGAAGTLLEQAEVVGLTPKYGCRMGICHECQCRKSAGVVRNILTGAVSDAEAEHIQLCINVPVGDVEIDL